MTATTRTTPAAVVGDAARIIEVTIGLGVDPTPGCSLCGRAIPCPVCTGYAAARALRDAGLLAGGAA